MRILISGGPGSGCTSTSLALGRMLGIPVFDSDTYFHKPTDPPFQEQEMGEVIDRIEVFASRSVLE